MPIVICAHCGADTAKDTSAINRANKEGRPLYCDRKCAGLARRGPEKTAAQKKEEKRLYDLNYRATNPTLKARKAAYYQRTKDPVREAEKTQRTNA